jgi:CubicO group peptidase (beta-lactamase class C family)
MKRAAFVAPLLAGLLAATVQAQAPQLTPAGQAIMARAGAIAPDRAVDGIEAYTPTETVTGAQPAPRALPRASARSVGLDPFALEKAQAWADGQESFALLVARDGKLVHERYAKGYTPESRFVTASMHKAVVALAYGLAIDDGKISLDDPLAKHLTEFAGHPNGAITIRQLLDMTSGLQPAPAKPGDPESGFLALMFANDIRLAAQKYVQAVPPASQFGYANINTQLAGMALEAAVGERYSSWLSRRLWAPLGAGDAAVWMDREGGNAHYFCCLLATPLDWLRVGELMRNDGMVGKARLLPEGWVKTVTSPSALNPNFGMNIWRGSPHDPMRGYGLGVAMKVPAKEPFARDDVFYVDGAGGQRVYVVPSERLTIIRIGKPSTTWDDSALVNLVLAGIKK